MKKSIKRWYRRAYPADRLGKSIDESMTFAKLFLGMVHGAEVYELIGVGDSLIRERVFAEIAKRMGCDYDVVYNIWLKS